MELLVVIGIIAVLISVLLPALNRARDAATTVQCAANMRTMGQALHSFANEWGGNRMPASAQLASPSWSSCTWDELINMTYFRKTGDRFKRTGVYWVNGAISRGQLGCPAIQPGEMRTGGRAFGINEYVQGNIGGDNSYDHPYPTRIHADFANPGASDPTRQMGWVKLGAKLNKFKNTSYKILVIEKERANASSRNGGSNPVVRGGGSYNPWAETNGNFSFRHAGKQRLNALFLDGHVETFHYRDTNFNIVQRWEFK